MSNFYYCNDCECQTDLVDNYMLQDVLKKLFPSMSKICKKCSGTNWKAMIDSTDGYPSKIVDDNFKGLLL